MTGQAPSYRDAILMVAMVRLLERRPGGALPVNLLAERLEVNRRTIIRYIDALGEGLEDQEGEPFIRRERREREAWAVLAQRAPALRGSIYHYAAVRAALQPLRALGETTLHDTGLRVLDQLERSLGGEGLKWMERVERCFTYLPFGPKDYRADDETMDAIVLALLRRQRVEVRYHGRARVLEPWTLVLYRDGLYLLAPEAPPEGGEAGPPRLYALDRMEGLRPLRDSVFPEPQGFDPRRFFAGKLGLWQAEGERQEVALAFSQAAAAYARERRWPGFQGWSESPDGRPLLRLRVPVTPEVVTWILTWGPEVEVMAPANLRQRVASLLERALGRYASPPPGGHGPGSPPRSPP